MSAVELASPRITVETRRLNEETRRYELLPQPSVRLLFNSKSGRAYEAKLTAHDLVTLIWQATRALAQCAAIDRPRAPLS